MVWQDDLFISMKGLREEAAEEVANTVAKFNCFTEDEGFCDMAWRCNSGWNEPRKVKEGGTRYWILEDFWDVTYVWIVDLKSAIGEVARVETKGIPNSIKTRALGECCTNSNPRNSGRNACTKGAN